MPRVLRIINRFNLGGPTYNVAYLTKYMSPEFETLLVGGEKDDSEDSSEFILKGLGIVPVIVPEMKRAIHPVNDIIAYRKIVQIIKEFKPDIVHTHASKAGMLGRIAASCLKVPIVLHTFHGHVFHSYFNPVSTEFFKSLERSLAAKSTRIIAISEKQKQELCFEHHICEAKKLEVIPLGFDLTRFKENVSEKRKKFRLQYNIDDNEVAIGIIGRIVPVKNHPFFLRAIKQVLEKTTQKIRVFIVGNGEDFEKVRLLAEELNLDYICSDRIGQKASITFTSWIKEIDYVNSGMDIIALTSLNEGTPVSLIEAQAANKPIVSTRVGGIEDVVLQDKTAILIENGNQQMYVNALLDLIENEDKRNIMGQKGLKHVEEKFTFTRLVDNMTALYHTLLKEVNYNNVK